MTVQDSAADIVYNGDGSTVNFAIPFAYFDKDHITATLRDAAGNTTTWVRGTQYSLSGDGTQALGQLDVSTNPTDYTPGSGSTLTIELTVPNDQQKALPLGGPFPSTQVEEGLDLGAQRDQALARDITSAIRVLPGDKQAGAMALALDNIRANKYLGFGASGELAYLSGTAGPVDVGESLVTPTGSSTSNTVSDLFGLGALPYENIKLYGAKGDFLEGSDGTTSEGSQVFSSTAVTFTDADVSKLIWVEGCSTTGVTITNIENGPVDAAYQWDADGVTETSYVNVTDDFNDSGAADVEPFPTTEAVGDRFYIGHIQEFDEVSITISTSGVGGVVQWKYWDGAAWSNLTVTDNTASFTAAPGTYTVTFTPPGDWETTQVNARSNGRFLYYITAEITTVYTTNPVLSQGILDGGRCRVTATNHLLEPLQWISVKDVVGTTEANGFFQIERISNNLFDIIGPTFANSYTSGGTVHGRLETTIQSVSGGNATLTSAPGATIAGTAGFGFGTNDTAAIQAAVDTGNPVIIPPGDFFTDRIDITTDRQKIFGWGGRLIAIPATLSNADSGRYAVVYVSADYVDVSGLFIDNPSLSNTKEQPEWPDSINTGIIVEGYQCRILNNVIRRFRDGINVQISSGTFVGPEYGHNIISSNIVWDVLGSGSGTDERIDNQGETTGDGIVSWGAATIITNNIVRPREGADCRIGIHVESLSNRHDPDPDVAGTYYPDSGAVISNNIVLAADVTKRNGRWRRGIVDEGVQHCTISNNVVYGGGWWSISMITGGSLADPKGNYVISNNVCIWTRPEVDISGDDWSPNRAVIAVYANTSGNLGNVSVVGNVIENWGHCTQGMYVGAFTGTTSRGRIQISGNSVQQRFNGLFVNSLFRMSQNGQEDLILNGNTFRGWHTESGQALVRIQNGTDSFVFSGNIVKWDIIPTGNDKCMEISGGSGVIVGNHFDGGDPTSSGGGDGVHVINMDRAIVTGNVIINCGDDAVDGFGTTSKILSNNILENIGDAGYVANWTPGATVLDVNNIKN